MLRDGGERRRGADMQSVPEHIQGTSSGQLPYLRRDGAEEVGGWQQRRCEENEVEVERES